MRNLKLIIEYDGRGYHGWQRQLGLVTVQQVLEECIGAVTQENVRVIGSGRTDAGVHAMNQVANFMTNSSIGEGNLLAGINSLLPRDIAVKKIMEVGADFHSRYHAVSKVYVYQIFNGTVRSALYRHYAWFVRSPLNMDLMKEGAMLLTGTHDFSSFCASGCGLKNHVRTVKRLELDRDKNCLLKVIVEADGFLKYMVRNMVGILVEIGKGNRLPNDVTVVIGAKDRRRAGVTAPAHGLFLKEVRYG
jgi:tRNA pseudouridine38-40 synthase